MATRRTPRAAGAPLFEPPADWQPTQAAPEPVLNTPYDEPTRHYTYIDRRPSAVEGRRPASYWYTTQKTGTTQELLFAEEERDELPLVNALRKDVKRWRESGYRGASAVTRELFAHWFTGDRHRPLFFCQREAVETVVYLLELAIPGRLAATGFRTFEVTPAIVDGLLKGEAVFAELGKEFFPRLVDPPADAGLVPLRRMGCKMATGSGKTLVMAMLVAWAFCNRGRNPASQHFPNAVLVCAPNLTVRNRLAVLRPDHAGNYYDAFDLVPAKYRELLNAGRVLVTNWHAFAPKSAHDEGGTSFRVVNKGAETNDAFALDRLGELAQRLPILVLNDEGHHCWRPKPGADDAKLDKSLTKEERDAIEEDREEARVWLAGLDRINNSGLLPNKAPGVLATVDLSATPFYLGASGYPEGSPFPWLVSDFGLVDAIESGIVKVPRLPVKDDSGAKDDAGRPDPKYFRLWEHIKGKLGTSDFVGKRPDPRAIYREAEGALVTLASQWKQRFDDVQRNSAEPNPVPPVLIVCCDNTDLAQVVFETISGEVEEDELGDDGKLRRVKRYKGSAVLSELANPAPGFQRTVRIDSKLLAKAEGEDGQTRDEAARALRELIDTVGRKGQPGEHVRCVVSVSMLTEGWDANNVTHILGLRAFGSQLLCEQVVGRGLRRTSYTPDPVTGKLLPEYVDVYGIPFSLIPFKGKSEKEAGSDPVYHHIYPVDERAEEHEIRIPVVESYTYDLRHSGIACDVDALPGLHVGQEPVTVYLAPTRGYRDQVDGSDDGEWVEQTRDEFYRQVRPQQVLFALTQRIVDRLVSRAEGKGAEELRRNNLLARHTVFPAVLGIVRAYVDRRVTFEPGVDRRELALQRYTLLLTERLCDGITNAAAPDDAKLLPVVNTFHPEVTTADVHDYTSRPVAALTRSHLNVAPVLSGWERDAIAELERSRAVKSFTPNVRKLGFRIAYEYEGQDCHYEPDFVVRLSNDRLLVLEIKGPKGELHAPDKVLAKSAAAMRWVQAVNNARRYGTWAYDICRKMHELPGVLARHAELPEEGGARVLPFVRVERPAPGEQFRRYVPVVRLRAAAGYFSEEQTDLEPLAEQAEEWVTWEGAPTFEDGMFVARVDGRSMEPDIPDGSYCLFRQPHGGSRQGRQVLVWHRGVTDSDTGGEYTVKVYTSEKGAGEGGWRHERIVLKPLNPDYEPIVLTREDAGDVRVLAEVVRVVGPTARAEA